MAFDAGAVRDLRGKRWPELLATESESSAVKAEACSDCHTFLKLFYLEQDPHADPFADDIATLALDLRVAGEGYARGGVSCFWS
jgi:FdhE protein